VEAKVQTPSPKQLLLERLERMKKEKNKPMERTPVVLSDEDHFQRVFNDPDAWTSTRLGTRGGILPI